MFSLNPNNSFIFPSSFPQFPSSFLNPYRFYQYMALQQQSSQYCKQLEYEKHFSKIYDLVKSKYKKQILSTLSLEEVGRCSTYLYETQNQPHKEKNLEGFSENEAKRRKIYCFLSTLTFFEVDSNKSHELFVSIFFQTICKQIHKVSERMGNFG